MDVPRIGDDSAVQQSIRAAFRRSYTDGLIAMRDFLAGQLDEGVGAREVASISKRLQDVSKELEKVQGEGEGSVDVAVDQPFRPEAV